MIQKKVPPPAGGSHEATDYKTKNATASAACEDADSQSVAGEEDPGASLDTPGSANPVPAGAMNPGDEAPQGTPGSGEGICRECGGSGHVGGAACPSCQGSGKVTVGVGGA